MFVCSWQCTSTDIMAHNTNSGIISFIPPNINSYPKENTRSTQRAQTSLAEADHDSHIAQCKNVEPWWLKANPKGFGSLPAPRSACATTIIVFFTHLLISEYPDHHQNLISSSLYYPGPLHKISSQSVHNFLSNVVHRQTLYANH